MSSELRACPFCGSNARFYPGPYLATIECDNCPAQMEYRGLEKVLTIMWNTRTQLEAKGWISVKDGLPEEGQMVLVCNRAGVLQADYIDGTYFVIEDRGHHLIKGVTHWQPLPPPPKA